MKDTTSQIIRGNSLMCWWSVDRWT